MKLRHSEECADARQRPAREDKGAPPCREVGERSRGSAGTQRRLLEAARLAAPLPRWRRFLRGRGSSYAPVSVSGSQGISESKKQKQNVGPEGKPAVWSEKLAQLAPLPLLSRAVGVGVGLC